MNISLQQTVAFPLSEGGPGQLGGVQSGQGGPRHPGDDLQLRAGRGPGGHCDDGTDGEGEVAGGGHQEVQEVQGGPAQEDQCHLVQSSLC